MMYQRMKDIRTDDVNMSVGIIEMVRPVSSGVLYTVEPMQPDSGEIVVSAIWGLGPDAGGRCYLRRYVCVEKRTWFSP